MSSSLWKSGLAIATLCFTLGIAPNALAMLRFGDTGRAVEDLQVALEITPDGVFGSETEAAVLQYQRFNGLTEDGIAGFDTLSSLGLDPDSQPDGSFLERSSSFSSSSAGGGLSSGPYTVVVPGSDPEILSRTRRIIANAEIRPDPERGDYINAGGYDRRATADEIAKELRDLNLDARVDFRRN